MVVVSKGLKNEFETAKVNEPSVFEPLKFYCNRVVRPETVPIHLKLYIIGQKGRLSYATD